MLPTFDDESGVFSDCEFETPSATNHLAMRVIIRVSAGACIGAGHVARTVALARVFEARGVEVRWVCEADAVRSLVDRGVIVERIRVIAPEALRGETRESVVDAEKQIRDATATLGPDVPDWVVADTYALGSDWHGVIRRAGARLLVFDDLCDRPIDADLVVNAGAAAGAYEALAPGAIVLCGLRHAVPGHAPRPPNLQSFDLVISFGAMDPSNLTASMLEVLRPRFELRRIAGRVIVQLSRDAPHRGAVEALVGRLHWSTMTDEAWVVARMSIGAAGVSIQERMQDGVPSIVLCAAPNQRRLLDAAVSVGAAVEARDLDDAARLLEALWEDSPRLAEMSAAGRAVIDGRGAARIAGAMNRITGVRLRAAAMTDASMLHQWRNHPEVRAVSHSRDPIPWDSHVVWLGNSLLREDRHILIAERRGRAVGMIRFDIASDFATVSIMLDPLVIGFGFGPAILDAGLSWVARRLPMVTVLRAEVRSGNSSSSRAFESSGYRLTRDESGVREYQMHVQSPRRAGP